MRNLSVFLLALAAVWWYLSSPNTQAVALPDGTLNYPEYRIEPVEEFTLEARVLSRQDYRSGRESELSPTDLALGWGPMADPAILASFDINQGNRWFTWKAERLPITRSEIVSSATNMHFIPASDAAAVQLREVAVHDRIRLHGRLVDVSAADGWRWQTSRSRSDSGRGACELLLLDRIEWL